MFRQIHFVELRNTFCCVKKSWDQLLEGGLEGPAPGSFSSSTNAGAGSTRGPQEAPQIQILSHKYNKYRCKFWNKYQRRKCIRFVKVRLHARNEHSVVKSYKYHMKVFHQILQIVHFEKGRAIFH